jgi:hypothetical protein
VTSLYVSDLASGTLSLVSGTPAGQIADGSATQPLFSPDGSLLAFLSTSNDLTSTPSGASVSANQGNTSAPLTNENLFVRNLAGGTTAAVSLTPGNTLSAGTVSQAAFSPDGKLLAFIATGNDLTSSPADTPLAAFQDSGPNLPAWYASNVYVRNLATGSTTPVSITPGGKLSNGFAGDLSFSPDGQSVAYLSSADDLTANATPPLADTAPAASNPLPNAPATPPANLFLTSLATGASTLVSVTPTGTLSSGNVLSYAISPDGTKVAFDAAATDLTNNPPTVAAGPATVAATSPVKDNVFVRDLSAQTTALVSNAPDGTLSSEPSSNAPVPLVFSPDGQTLYFSTNGALVAGDTNNTSDIYASTAPWATPGEIRFATWQYDANEASGQAVITVVRNAPLSAPVTVNYAVQDNTAKAGNDYQATSGTLSFAAGQASATFTIPLNAAASFAGTRTATITLSNPTGAPLGFPTATLNLTGVMPTVPVSITATSTATPHTHNHRHTPKPTSPSTPSATAAAATPTGTSTASATSSGTSDSTPATSGDGGGGGGTTVTTVYTASGPPAATSGTTSTTGSTGSNGSTATTPAAGSTTATATAASNTTASTPTSTSGATAPSSSSAATSNAGPFVAKLALRTNRHKITGVIVSFNESVAAASAGNLANYTIHLLSHGRRTKHGTQVTSLGRGIGITAATYDPTTQSVALALSSPVRSNQAFQLRVGGGAGGITDSSGQALNSPSQGAAGSDFVYNL